MNGKWELAKVDFFKGVSIEVFSTNPVMLKKLTDIVYDSVSQIGDEKIRVKKVHVINDFSNSILLSRTLIRQQFDTIRWTAHTLLCHEGWEPFGGGNYFAFKKYYECE